MLLWDLKFQTPEDRVGALFWRMHRCVRILHKELVGSGKMTNRAFHDAVLRENRLTIEMIRASLTRRPLTRDFKTAWKFYGPNPGGP